MYVLIKPSKEGFKMRFCLWKQISDEINKSRLDV